MKKIEDGFISSNAASTKFFRNLSFTARFILGVSNIFICQEM